MSVFVQNMNSMALGFSAVSWGGVVGSVVTTGGIAASPPPSGVSVAAQDPVKAEGDSGTTSFTFTITRTESIGFAVLQNWFVFGNGTTPASGLDFIGGTFPSGTVNFAAGETTKTVTVQVAGDSTAGLNDTFLFSLTNIRPVFGAPLPSYVAQGTILNDDAVVATTLSLAVRSTLEQDIPGTPSVTQAESNFGNGPFITYTVWRNGDVSQAGTVDWALTGTGANPLSATDFPGSVLPSGTVSFAAGAASATFDVFWHGDFLPEADETGLITLSNPSGGAGVDVGTATLVLTNDDFVTQFGGPGSETINVEIAFPNPTVDASQGGNDIINGSTQNDILLLGAALTALDKVNGAGGADTVILDGDYSTGLTLGKTTLTNVETILLTGGHSYRITTNDATVATNSTLTIDATALGAINSATVNGAAEKSASFNFLGGAGNDSFTGGGGADSFYGAFGADTLNGGKGADIFQYLRAGDSPLLSIGGNVDDSQADSIVSFQTGTDFIELSGLLIPFAAQSVVTRSTTGFSTNLNNSTGFFGTAGIAVEYAGSGKNVSTRIYVDANHDGNLGAGDMLIKMTGAAKNSIGVGSFHFQPNPARH